MDRIQDGRYVMSGEERGRETAPFGILLLSLLLVGVFFLAVGAYGIFEADGGLAEGDLPNAVLVFREFVEENESISVFLGFSDDGDDVQDAEKSSYDERINSAAEEYIRTHQSA